jgi:hypothetical protein
MPIIEGSQAFPSFRLYSNNDGNIVTNITAPNTEEALDAAINVAGHTLCRTWMEGEFDHFAVAIVKSSDGNYVLKVIGKISPKKAMKIDSAFEVGRTMAVMLGYMDDICHLAVFPWDDGEHEIDVELDE